MRGVKSAAGLARFTAVVALAGLLASVIIFELMLKTAMSDWMGEFSNPLDVCGYDRTPDEYPCIGLLFRQCWLRCVLAGLVTWGPIYWDLRRRGRAKAGALLAAGAVVGAIDGFVWVFLRLVFRGFPFVSLSFQARGVPRDALPQLFQAALNSALIGAALGLFMATVFALCMGMGLSRKGTG